MVCYYILISILPTWVEPLEMLYVKAADTLAPQAGDLTPEDFLSPCASS